MLSERAVSIDSLFTMAISDLSYYYRKLGKDSIALAYHRRVLPLIGRVTDRERYYILTGYYGPSFEFDAQNAFQSAREMVLRYPNSADSHADLGFLGMYFCELSTALEENQKALAIDSVTDAGSIYNNSGYAAALAGDVASALGFFRKSKQLRPTYRAIDIYMAHAYWVDEAVDSTERILKEILPVAKPGGASTHAQLACLYYSQGRLARASDECASGIALCRSGRLAFSEAFLHYLLGEASFELGDRAGCTREMRMAEEIARSPYTDLVLVALSYAAKGNAQAAEKLVRRLQQLNSADPFFLKRRDDFFHLVQGELSLAHGMTNRAMTEFNAVQKLHCGDPIYFTAQRGAARCAALVSDSLGILQFKTLLEHRGELIMGALLSFPSTGAWTSYILSEAHLEIGKLYVKQRNTVEVSRHLTAALRYWREADPSFRKAQEAKELMAKLQKVWNGELKKK